MLALQDIELDVLDVGVVVFGDVGDGFDAADGVIKIIILHVRRAAQKAQGLGEGVAAGEHVVPHLVNALGGIHDGVQGVQLQLDIGLPAEIGIGSQQRYVSQEQHENE